MDWRSLFGSSARQAVAPGAEFAGKVRSNPAMNPAFANALTDEMGDPGALTRAPVLDGNPERSYLGGLVKYQRPEGQSGADRMQLLGATLSDIGGGLSGQGGGSLQRVQEGFRKRSEKAKSEEDLQRLKDMAAELYPDDEEAQFLFGQSPDAFIKQRLASKEPKQPTLVNTRLGPRLYDPKTGKYTILEDIPERLPPGYTYDADGNAVIDPQYVAGQGALAETRAAAVARHRAPPRPRAGSGAPAAATGKPPWERAW